MSAFVIILVPQVTIRLKDNLPETVLLGHFSYNLASLITSLRDLKERTNCSLTDIIEDLDKHQLVIMDGYSLNDLADMHLVYGAAGGNGREASRLYQERFPNRRQPGHTMFHRIDQRLRETGFLLPPKRRN